MKKHSVMEKVETGATEFGGSLFLIILILPSHGSPSRRAWCEPFDEVLHVLSITGIHRLAVAATVPRIPREQLWHAECLPIPIPSIQFNTL
jgi:hypothetical protein